MLTSSPSGVLKVRYAFSCVSFVVGPCVKEVWMFLVSCSSSKRSVVQVSAGIAIDKLVAVVVAVVVVVGKSCLEQCRGVFE